MKDKNGDLLTGSHILNRWNNFSQLLNVYRIIDVRQIEIQTAVSLVLLMLKLLLQNWKGINRQVVIKLRQNIFKQEVKYDALRYRS
jgi:hypothetical protein